MNASKELRWRGGVMRVVRELRCLVIDLPELLLLLIFETFVEIIVSAVALLVIFTALLFELTGPSLLFLAVLGVGLAACAVLTTVKGLIHLLRRLKGPRRD